MGWAIGGTNERQPIPGRIVIGRHGGRRAAERRIALGIRAQLLLVLTVFLAIPFLGWGYVRELERVLRDAQEQKLAGTAQAVATALHDRARLFDLTPIPLAALDAGHGAGGPVAPTPHPGAVAEIAQILQGMSRTTARIWVVDRRLDVLARTGSLHAAAPSPEAEPAGLARVGRWIERTLLHPLYGLVLAQPTEEFAEDSAGEALANMREVDGALAGILTTARRRTPDGRAVIVAAAHPIWVGDQVEGAVVVEETANSALRQRNRAFERLFTIVLATLLVGSVALTLFASRLTARIRKLRDDAEAAIDAQGRVRGALAGSRAGDEIGDLSRSFSSVLSRLAQYAGYRENMASRLSHELRTPLAVVRSSLDNLRLQPLPDDARVYIDRAQGGLQRLAEILTRMTEATRLEQSLRDAERERFDLGALVSGCVDGYRLAYPGRSIVFTAPAASLAMDGAPDLIAQMLDKLVANAHEFAPPGTAIEVRLARSGDRARLETENEGPRLPEGMRERLFDSMVSIRPESGGEVPHLGLGLYIVRLIAEFHRGTVRADDRADGAGVVVTVLLPLAGAD
jgi:two-component system sensor histidine kinase ChvG